MERIRPGESPAVCFWQTQPRRITPTLDNDEHALRIRIGLDALAEWHAEHGAFTLQELAAARSEMAAADAALEASPKGNAAARHADWLPIGRMARRQNADWQPIGGMRRPHGLACVIPRMRRWGLGRVSRQPIYAPKGNGIAPKGPLAAGSVRWEGRWRRRVDDRC
jgi:hypothetical protein